MSRYEIRITGTGGQGIISSTILLGQAVARFDNRYATQTQSYGPESRGSAARAGVVISGSPIDFPKIVDPDVLVIMSQAACNKYLHHVKPSATVIIDPDMVTLKPDEIPKTLYKIPATIAGDTISRLPLVANIVMLGAVAAITQVTSMESLEKSIEVQWPRLVEPNIKALRLGEQLGVNAMNTLDHVAIFPLPKENPIPEIEDGIDD